MTVLSLVGSVVTAAAMTRNLLLLSSPYACARLPAEMLVLMGVLILLQLFFLWDTARRSGKKYKGEKGAQRE